MFPERLQQLLSEHLPPGDWSLDHRLRARFGCDAFEEGPGPAAVIAPGSIDALAGVLPALVEAGFAVVPCGASLSYSSGTLPQADPWIAIDLRGLSRVLEINALDRTVRVEAGVTWATLRDSLAPHGLRAAFWGPASGLHATVGGTLANDGIFFGSAAFGAASDLTRGVTVLLADGSRLGAGTHALLQGSGPLLARALGPDLTSIFLGSCGAFGIIVEASLALTDLPAQVRGAGFRCADAQIAAGALASLARVGVASEAIALSAASPGGPYSLSVSVESTLEEDVASRLERAMDACVHAGAKPEGDGLITRLRQSPFQPPTMLLGPSGRRWVPVHGIVPHSRVSRAIESIERAMREQAALVEEICMSCTITLAAIGSDAVLVEANLYWPDPGNALLDHYLASAAGGPADPARLERQRRIRASLVEALDASGATHLQLGRLYPWLERLDPPSRALAIGLKALLDPRSAMNPGVLGLAAESTSR